MADGYRSPSRLLQSMLHLRRRSRQWRSSVSGSKDFAPNVRPSTCVSRGQRQRRGAMAASFYCLSCKKAVMLPKDADRRRSCLITPRRPESVAVVACSEYGSCKTVTTPSRRFARTAFISQSLMRVWENSDSCKAQRRRKTTIDRIPRSGAANSLAVYKRLARSLASRPPAVSCSVSSSRLAPKAADRRPKTKPVLETDYGSCAEYFAVTQVPIHVRHERAQSAPRSGRCSVLLRTAQGFYGGDGPGRNPPKLEKVSIHLRGVEYVRMDSRVSESSELQQRNKI